MSFDKPAIILDTNVLISAAILPASRSAQALVFALRNHQPIFSESTWNELREVIARPKFCRYLNNESRIAYLGLLIRSSQFVESNSTVTDCVDPKDNKFIALAVDAMAETIISGDNHLLVMHPYKSVAILTPSEFLNRIE